MLRISTPLLVDEIRVMTLLMIVFFALFLAIEQGAPLYDDEWLMRFLTSIAHARSHTSSGN